MPEIEQRSHDRAREMNTAFEPILPANIAAWQDCVPAVYDNELGMQHAERKVKDAFDLEI